MLAATGPTRALALLLLALYCHCQTFLVQAVQSLPPNFFNHNGCLYAIQTEGHYRVTFRDAADPVQANPLGKPVYDTKSVCINGDVPAKLIINYDMSDNYFQSMSIEFQITNDTKNGIWQVSSAILKISPINPSQYPDNTLILRPANGGQIYAPLSKSYSCSSLVFTNSTPQGPTFRITLKRFQLQPFPELPNRIFAVSQDCASWLTLPQIMGFLLVLFIIFVVLIGAYMLLELGNQSGDLRFSKQGGMLMNQAQLDATKAD